MPRALNLAIQGCPFLLALLSLSASLCRYCRFLTRRRKTQEKASFSIPEITAMVYSPQVSHGMSPCRRNQFGTEKPLCSLTETTGFSDVVSGHDEEGSGVQEPLWLLYGYGNDVSPEAHVSGHVAILESSSGGVEKAHHNPRASWLQESYGERASHLFAGSNGNYLRTLVEENYLRTLWVMGGVAFGRARL